MCHPPAGSGGCQAFPRYGHFVHAVCHRSPQRHSCALAQAPGGDTQDGHGPPARRYGQEVYQPTIGLHRDVAGIDFVSMHPGIMVRFNISPEVPRAGSDRSAAQAFRRWADPLEIAEPIYFLASEGASFVTGADWLVDCGWVAK